MDFFQFLQNLTIYTDLAVIWHIEGTFKPFVSHLLAEDPGPSRPNVVAILSDFDEFLLISSKLDYSHAIWHLTSPMPNLTHFFDVLAEDPEPQLPVLWQYCQILTGFFEFSQNSNIYTDLTVNKHL